MGKQAYLTGVIAGLALALAAPAHAAEWLAGDLHVHTCFSHDAWCPQGDDNTGPDEFYTLSLGVRERFAQAGLQGLDYLAISDHNDVRSSSDPGFGAGGVIGVPAYEKSLRGHAQMLGAQRIYDPGGQTAAEVDAVAAQLRADGGAFQVNHPGEQAPGTFTFCGDTAVLDWKYGYDVEPDTIELLNPTSPVQVAERWWECWLTRGARVGATGGSDSHYAWTAPVQGPGQPTTWVLASERSGAGVLAALRAGRTAVSRRTPLLGGAPLLIEADADGDGSFEAAVGDAVPRGAAMRVRSAGPLQAGFVRVRANGSELVEDALLVPGGDVRFRAPAEAGWVRASLHLLPGTAALGCDPLLHQAVSLCPYDHLLEGFTSPLYVEP